MDKNCTIVIDHIAPEGSKCEICGKPAPWQMYCKDCGYILRFYCDEHAYLSQTNKKIETHIKKASRSKMTLKIENEIISAQEEWKNYINNARV